MHGIYVRMSSEPILGMDWHMDGSGCCKMIVQAFHSSLKALCVACCMSGMCWQVLWGDIGGWDGDIAAGVEAALMDGVDALSVSIGEDSQWDTMSDVTSVACMNAGG